MNGYSIFNHAQFGHDEVSTVKRKQQDVPDSETKPAPQAAPITPVPTRRVRSPRGWAVEAGLGLGPQFK